VNGIIIYNTLYNKEWEILSQKNANGRPVEITSVSRGTEALVKNNSTEINF